MSDGDKTRKNSKCQKGISKGENHEKIQNVKEEFTKEIKQETFRVSKGDLIQRK